MLCYSIAHHRLLTMEEILSSNLIYAAHQHLLDKEGIALLRNTPDEIAETVKEALLVDAYSCDGRSSGENARANFTRLNQHYERHLSRNIGLYFAAKYASRLFGDPQEPSIQALKAFA
jgi:hypothetical protein